MIKSIGHVGISTGDIDRLASFYRDKLGFEDVYALDLKAGDKVADSIFRLKDAATRIVVLKLGDVSIELFQFRHPTPKPSDPQRPVCDHGITHLCLQVEDIEGEYNRLSAAGMEFHAAPVDVGGGARSTYARDPDGNVIEFLEASLEETARQHAGSIA